MLGIAMPRRGYRYRPYRLSEHNLLVALRTAACRQQLGLCYWCGEPMIAGDVEPTDPKLCTADHLVPQYAGMAREPGGVLAEALLPVACNKDLGSNVIAARSILNNALKFCRSAIAPFTGGPGHLRTLTAQFQFG